MNNKEEFKLTTVAYCSLIYFVSLLTISTIQGDKTAPHGSGFGSVAAVIIFIFFLPIIATAIAKASRNSKYSYLEKYSLFLYIASFTFSICFELTSIAYFLTNLIPVFGFLTFLFGGKREKEILSTTTNQEKEIPELNFVEHKKKQIEDNKVNNNKKQKANRRQKTNILISSILVYFVSLYCAMLIEADKTASGGTKRMNLIEAVFVFIIILIFFTNSVLKNKRNKDIRNFVLFQHFTLFIFIISFILSFINIFLAIITVQSILIVAFMLLFLERNSY